MNLEGENSAAISDLPEKDVIGGQKRAFPAMRPGSLKSVNAPEKRSSGTPI